MSDPRRRGVAAFVVIAGGLLCGATAAPSTGQPDPWQPADSAYRWSFPRDHWAHPAYKTEWWYLTGQLTPAGDSLPRFGYQFTFFRVGLSPAPPPVASSWTASGVIMGHVALTDLVTRRHVFSEVFYRASPLLGGFATFPDTMLAWSRGPAGTASPWRLVWNGAGFDVSAADTQLGVGLHLRTRPAKPLVFEGPNGYSRKGSGRGAASLYYSFTRLTTTGWVGSGDDSVAVHGESWMDKEFGSNQLGADQVGWDWFSLQLDDGRELMLYRLRRGDGETSFARGTLVGPGGGTTFLQAGDWQVDVQDRWHSPKTDARYPARWRVTLPAWSLDLTIDPLLADQENVSTLVPGLAYWEGAVLVRENAGRVVGRGYVELTGYARGGRLPI